MIFSSALLSLLSSTIRPGTVAQHGDTMPQLAEQWRCLSPTTRRRYEEKAAQMSQDRAAMANHGLDRQAKAELGKLELSTLSERQKKRMNQKRLDGTLQKVACHPGWNAGLGLSDHMSPLRASFVDENLDEKAAAQEVDRVFSYDRTVVPNTCTSTDLVKPCCSLYGGVCCKSKFYDVVRHCTNQLQIHLKNEKLDDKVCLLHFEHDGQAAPSSSSRAAHPSFGVWCVLGCTVLRPLSHVLHKMFPEHPGALQFSLKNGMPDMVTSQQLVQSIAMRLESEHGSWNPKTFSIEVAWLANSYSAFHSFPSLMIFPFLFEVCLQNRISANGLQEDSQNQFRRNPAKNMFRVNARSRFQTIPGHGCVD